MYMLLFFPKYRRTSISKALNKRDIFPVFLFYAKFLKFLHHKTIKLLSPRVMGILRVQIVQKFFRQRKGREKIFLQHFLVERKSSRIMWKTPYPMSGKTITDKRLLVWSQSEYTKHDLMTSSATNILNMRFSL